MNLYQSQFPPQTHHHIYQTELHHHRYSHWFDQWQLHSPVLEWNIFLLAQGKGLYLLQVYLMIKVRVIFLTALMSDYPGSQRCLLAWSGSSKAVKAWYMWMGNLQDHSESRRAVVARGGIYFLGVSVSPVTCFSRFTAKTSGTQG